MIPKKKKKKKLADGWENYEDLVLPFCFMPDAWVKQRIRCRYCSRSSTVTYETLCIVKQKQPPEWSAHHMLQCHTCQSTLSPVPPGASVFQRLLRGVANVYLRVFARVCVRSLVLRWPSILHCALVSSAETQPLWFLPHHLCGVGIYTVLGG